MHTNKFSALIDAAGGQRGLARLITEQLPHLHIRQSHVQGWLASNNPMPPGDYLPALEVIAKDLGLCITGQDLRPDIYPKSKRKAKD